MTPESKRQADEGEGIIEKYRVERLAPSRRGIDHSDCRYFVLDPAHDEMARMALPVLASLARSHGYVPLADDLDGWAMDLGLTKKATSANHEALLREAARPLPERIPPGLPGHYDRSPRDPIEVPPLLPGALTAVALILALLIVAAILR